MVQNSGVLYHMKVKELALYFINLSSWENKAVTIIFFIGLTPRATKPQSSDHAHERTCCDIPLSCVLCCK